ncbi:MAG: HD-GYP domain-containing protein [Solirubrobacteraceae bacterium]|nr:HD-GYP domain-containing protein [Patulibacter sp.]
MLDPALKPLHHRRRTWMPGADPRRWSFDGVHGVILVAAVAVLFVVAPGGHWAPAWQVAALLGAACFATAVRFEVGAGWSSPMQIAQVPLWLAVPPAWFPVFVAISLVVGQAIEWARAGHGRPTVAVLYAADDLWHAIGAAVVLALVGPLTATMGDFPWVLLVFAGQVLFDAVYTLAHGRFAWDDRLRRTDLLKASASTAAVDLALLPVGFLVAYAFATEPLLALSLVPLIGLFAVFAREREERMSKASELSSAYRGTAQLMATMLKADDSYTGGEHTTGVVEMALALGRELALPDDQLRSLEFGAMLHDIGKLHVPNEILNKPGKLTDEEWAIIREHPALGQQMLDTVGGALSETGHIVRAHHERYDGTGYPDGLRGEAIPLESRIITVCDSFSAMTTDRPYRGAMSAQEAAAELDRCCGTQFDPVVVAAMHRVLAGRGQILTVSHPRPAASRTGGRLVA